MQNFELTRNSRANPSRSCSYSSDVNNFFLFQMRSSRGRNSAHRHVEGLELSYKTELTRNSHENPSMVLYTKKKDLIDAIKWEHLIKSITIQWTTCSHIKNNTIYEIKELGRLSFTSRKKCKHCQLNYKVPHTKYCSIVMRKFKKKKFLSFWLSPLMNMCR